MKENKILDETLKELRKIIKEDYEITLGKNDVMKVANSFIRFFLLLTRSQNKETIKKQEVEIGDIVFRFEDDQDRE